MDAMITEFECNLFRSVETTRQRITRRPIVQSKMLNHMLYSVHMNVGFPTPQFHPEHVPKFDDFPYFYVCGLGVAGEILQANPCYNCYLMKKRYRYLLR